MDCLYFTYMKYCDKDYAKEKHKYGYSDLTEHECKFKDCQEKCKDYIKKESK